MTLPFKAVGPQERGTAARGLSPAFSHRAVGGGGGEGGGRFRFIAVREGIGTQFGRENMPYPCSPCRRTRAAPLFPRVSLPSSIVNICSIS